MRGLTIRRPAIKFTQLKKKMDKIRTNRDVEKSLSLKKKLKLSHKKDFKK